MQHCSSLMWLVVAMSVWFLVGVAVAVALGKIIDRCKRDY